MSVEVERIKPVVQPPAKSIVVTDDIGDRLVFNRGRDTRGASVLRAELEIAAGRDLHVRVTADDARDLAAALIEWADFVGA